MGVLRRRLAVLGLVACTATIAGPASGQISPGELSRWHADMEGMRNCLKCHELGKGPSDAKCLDCHKEIAWGIKEGRGYHYRLKKAGDHQCFDCHNEHAGRDFDLIRWPNGMKNFDHGQTGFQLRGRHAKLECRDCHKTDLIRENLSRHGDQVHINRTFLGLRSGCLDCHRDEHRGQLAKDCAVCHSNDGWKPATGFSHDKTAFPLTGRHVRVECVKCHKTVHEKDPQYPQSESFVRFTGLARKNCTPCHKDVHRGKYGATCAKCHNTSGWQDIPPNMFDHAKTRFPLEGRHRDVTCSKCHPPGAKKSPLAHERCLDCHKDIHQGQFAARAGGGACEGCHTVNGFIPAVFTAEDHAKTRFALAGAHLAQPCNACHPNATSSDGVVFRLFAVDGATCQACHSDPHAGQFALASPPKGCDSCHGIQAWRPAEFDHDRDSAYRLEGQHRTVPCASCHVRVTENGVSFVRYRPIDPTCKTCHRADVSELSRTGADTNKAGI